METLLCLLSIVLLQSIVTVAQETRVVCVDAITDGGICAGGNLGSFSEVGNPGTRCCTELNAAAYYDVDMEVCTSCNVQTYTCFTACGGTRISGGQSDIADCCNALVLGAGGDGGVGAGSYVDDLTGNCFNCPVQTFTCLTGPCPGSPSGTAATPAGCCSGSATNYRDPSGNCLSCANVVGPSELAFICTDRADNGDNQCDGEILGVFTSTTQCCNMENAGGYYIHPLLICAECDSPIQCFSDGACQDEIGTQKNTLVECCQSFDQDGVEGITFMQGDACTSCATVTDVNECEENEDICGAFDGVMCINTPGSYVCQCPNGFMLVTFPVQICEDVNECASSNPCGSGICMNTPGSYTCDCNDGFMFNSATCVDVNECTSTDPQTQHDCDAATSTCVNTFGSFDCMCNPGFEQNDDGDCIDVNECDADTSLCDPGTCQNVDGAFYTCSCDAGFEPNNELASEGLLDCIDVNECTDETDNCDGTTATCENTEGSFICVCNSGYENVVGGSCSDINECTDNTDLCGIGGDAVCMNLVGGGYTCNCLAGSVSNNGDPFNLGLMCIDIDECASEPPICGGTSMCYNIPNGGFYSCTCAPGTTSNNGDETMGLLTCDDINECMADPTLCGSFGTCVNEEDGGFYSCDCNDGFGDNSRDGGDASINTLTCVDADECLDDPAICGGTSTCINIPSGNGYACLCAPGTLNNGGDPIMLALTCEDFDECVENPDLCGIYGSCVNVDDGGFYSCDCDSGFRPDDGDPSTGDLRCIDIDECMEDAHNCHPDAHCTNTIGGFECECFDGFKGDGVEKCKVREPIPIFLWPLLRGSAGSDGYMGPKGEKGWLGPQGDMGEDGPPGVMGEKGDRGPQGEQGPPGSDGSQGGAGDSGEMGDSGNPGMDSNSAGVVFIAWGQTVCPSTSGTSLLYQGRAATARRSDTGTGTNYLCLPDDPAFSVLASSTTVNEANVVGVRYVTDNEPLESFDNMGMPCSVCYSTRAVQLMIPGSAACPDIGSWRMEYIGYLMSSRDTPSVTLVEMQSDSNFRNEYICVSSNAGSVPSPGIGSNEAEVYHVHIDCSTGASLDCTSAGQLTCAVCTLELP